MSQRMGRPNRSLMMSHFKRIGLEAKTWQEKEAAGAEGGFVPSV